MVASLPTCGDELRLIDGVHRTLRAVAQIRRRQQGKALRGEQNRIKGGRFYRAGGFEELVPGDQGDLDVFHVGLAEGRVEDQNDRHTRAQAGGVYAHLEGGDFDFFSTRPG